MIPNKLYFAITVSVVLHAFLVVGAVWGWNQADNEKRVKTPNFVEAKLVKLKPQAKKAAPKKTKKIKKIDLTAKRKEQERLKRAQEKKRKAALAKKKAAEKKKRAEKKAKEIVEKKKRQEQLLRQQEFDALLHEEEQMMLEQEYANEAQSYIALIQKRISDRFVPPPSARKGMQAKVSIQLVPTGRIVSVSIVKGSGNDAFDRAARQAVLDVEEFTEVKKMPSEVFERFFRKFSVIVNPQGLRL